MCILTGATIAFIQVNFSRVFNYYFCVNVTLDKLFITAT